MRTTKRGKLAALAVGLAVIAAACGSDDKSESTQPPSTDGSTPVETTPGETTPEGTTGDTTDTGGDAAMTITYDINPDAVWDDGSPITVADFECTWQANLNTPGTLSTAGWENITAVTAGESDKQAVVSLDKVYAPYRGLFGALIKKDAVDDCNDVSEDFATDVPFSGRAWKLDSWSETQEIFVPNENYWGEDKAGYDQLIMVPKADSDTEIASLKAGEVDFIYPQYFGGIQDALADPNVKVAVTYGGDYEALYMNELEGRPFADPALREGFYKSIDLDALFTQIYIPIDPNGQLLTCGPIVPGDYCPEGIFGNKFDLDAAATVLEAGGWAKDGSGMWAKDGEVPEIKWMVNAGNTRRENTQAYLIPLLQAAGFNVVADNCEADCVFQQRLPGLDYDLAMYISTAPPDPGYLVPSFAGDQIPTADNGNVGQNTQAWNNEEATKLLHDSDQEVDVAKRADLLKQAIVLMDTDSVLIPLFQFPKSGAYRTDKVDNVEGNLTNYEAFIDTPVWTDLDGDGKIVIGAEQWPGCLNPITECANSSWYQWLVGFPLFPAAYDTTNDGGYVPTPVLTGEATVVVAGS